MHLMSPDEVRSEVNTLRTLRVNAQSLGKALREGAAREAAKPAVKKVETLDDIMRGLV